MSGIFGDPCDTPVVSVTSIVSLLGGSFITSVSDGEVFGPDPAFDLMHLSFVQPVGDGAYRGVAAGGLTTVALGSAQPPAVGWSTGGGNPQLADAAATPQLLFRDYARDYSTS